MATISHTHEVRAPAQYAAFVGMCLIWGTTFLAIRIGSEAVPPLWGATIRLVLAALLNAILALLTRAAWPRGSALRGIALFGFLNLGVNFALLYWGELTVPSGIAAVFYATVPLTTGIFAWMLGVQALERTHMIAAGVGLAGVALIFSGELRWGAPAPALLGVFTGATLASLAGVILKKVPPHSTFVVNAIGAAVGACVCFLGSLILGESRGFPRGAAAWGPILYLTVAGNLGAYVLYTWLLTQWKVTTVSVGALIIPVIAVVVGALVRGESPAPDTYLGAALVLFGVSVSLFEGRRASPAT
jgi:drug/metabolite transporter (DMT)-like permease